MDDDRFLKLLVTQLKNQDPLNPMDNAQLTTQMAQISTVTGVESLNKSVKSLVDQINEAQSVQATPLIGRDVLVSGNSLTLDDSRRARGALDFSQTVDRATVTIKDAAGTTVRSIDLGPNHAGRIGFQWDGTNDGGTAVAPGNYTFSVDARAADKAVTADTLVLGHVLGLTKDSTGKAQLDLGVLGTRAVAEVKEIL